MMTVIGQAPLFFWIVMSVFMLAGSAVFLGMAIDIWRGLK